MGGGDVNQRVSRVVVQSELRIQKGDGFRNFPDIGCDIGLHGRSYAESLMDETEIMVHKMKGNRVFVVFNFLGKCVRKTSKGASKKMIAAEPYSSVQATCSLLVRPPPNGPKALPAIFLTRCHVRMHRMEVLSLCPFAKSGGEHQTFGPATSVLPAFMWRWTKR